MVFPSVQEVPTYPCLINANIEGIDQIFQEHADQPEVEPTDTPGPVHQDHDICDGFGVAHKLIDWVRKRKEGQQGQRGADDSLFREEMIDDEEI